MRLLKTYPRGTAITAEMWNELVEAINQRTPLPNNTIKLDETQSGFMLKTKPGSMMQPEINYSFKVGYTSETLTIQDGYVNYLFNKSILVEGYDGLTPETTYNIPTDILRDIFTAREQGENYEAVLFFRLQLGREPQYAETGGVYLESEGGPRYHLKAKSDMEDELTQSRLKSYQVVSIADFKVKNGVLKIMQRQVADITMPMVMISSTPGGYDWRAANELGV